MNRKWKNVSNGECFKIILISIICVALAVVPATISPFAFSFKALPYIGDNTLIPAIQGVAKSGLVKLISQLSSYTGIIDIVFKATYLSYFAILVANIFFAILLVLTKSKVLRIIFRTFGIILGIVLVIGVLLSIGYFVAIYGFSKAGGSLSVSSILNDYKALFPLGYVFFGAFLASRQFSWYKRPYGVR